MTGKWDEGQKLEGRRRTETGRWHDVLGWQRHWDKRGSHLRAAMAGLRLAAPSTEGLGGAGGGMTEAPIGSVLPGRVGGRGAGRGRQCPTMSMVPYDHPMYMAFIDLTKTFDSINHEAS